MAVDDFAAASGGQLAGTRSLQQSIDALTQSNQQLKGALQQNSSAACGGMVTTPALASGAAGQTFTSGSFAKNNGGYLSAQYISDNRMSQQGGYQTGPSSATYAAGTSGPAIPLSQPGEFPRTNGGYQPSSYAFQSSAAGPPEQHGTGLATISAGSTAVQPANAGNGGYGSSLLSGITSSYGGAPSGNGGTGSGGGGVPGSPGLGAGGGQPSAGGRAGGILGATAGAVLGAVTSEGEANLGPQTVLNAAYQQAMLGTAPGAKDSYKTIYTQMAGWGNTKPNAVSTSAADAAQGFLTLGNLEGTPGDLGSTAYGKAVQSAWAGAGVLTPGLGSTGAANVASDLYNPVTSQNMLQLGYGVTPRAARGSNRGPASMSQVTQGMLQKWYGSGSVSSEKLAAGLAPGGHDYLSLQALGLNPQEMTPLLEGYNKLYQQGVSPGKADKLFQQAANGKTIQETTTAQKTLEGYGILKSDFQTMKDVNAQTTARQSEISQGFTSGLNTASGLLIKFNSALNALLNGPLGKALGFSEGFTAGMKGPGSHGNPLLDAVGGGFVGSLVGKGLGSGAKWLGSKLFKKPASAAASGAETAAKGAEKAAPTLKATLGKDGVFSVSDTGEIAKSGLKGGVRGGVAGVLASVADTLITNWIVKQAKKHLGNSWGSAAEDLGKFSMDPFKAAGDWTGKGIVKLGKNFIHGVFGGAAGTKASTPVTKGSKPGTTLGSTSGPVQTAIKDAEAQVGKPYVWGGDSPATSFDCCLVPDAHVQTTRGPVPIVDIRPGDEVITWEGGEIATHTVVARSAPMRQMTYRIRTNRRSLDASGNHPFHVVRTGRGQHARLEWARLDSLHPGDYIVTLSSLPDGGTVPEGLHGDPNYLWLLGAMFGDGHLQDPPRTIFLCMFGEQQEQARSVLEALTDNKVTDHPGHGLYCTDTALARQLSEDGLQERSTERTVPSWVWELPHKLIEVFLDGYTTADGHRSPRIKDPALQYKAANETLVRQIRNLHIVLGHNVTRVRKQERTRPITIKGKLVKNARPLYCFEAYENSSRKAHGYFGVRPNVKKLFPSENFMPEKILSIEPLHEQDTYDIEVEGAHNFIAEGINVHNSGLVMWAYGQAGVKIPRTSQQQWAALKNKSVPMNKVQAGDILFQAGSDGTFDNPGHEALAISDKQIVEAATTGTNIRIRGYSDTEWQHAARPVGGTASTSVATTASPTPTTTATGGGVSTPVAGAAVPSMGAGGLGLSPGTYGSSDDLTNIQSALLGGISGGNVWAGLSGGLNGPQASTAASSTSAGAGTSAGNPSSGSVKAPQGKGTSSGGSANGTQLYKYLLSTLFGGNKIAAAGATASIWGESLWNPFAQGTGGRGLIGWTPPSTISDAAFNGGMATQLPAIIKFVQDNGDMGAVQSMKGATTIAQAANIWGQKVERFGVNDVHAEGVHAAGAIAGLPASVYGMSDGGDIVVGERGPEIIRVTGQSARVFSAAQTHSMLNGTSAQPAQAPWVSAQAHSVLSGTSDEPAKASWVSAGMRHYSYANSPQNSHVKGTAASMKVDLNIAAGAIVIQGGSGNSSDISNAVSQGIRETVHMLENHQTLQHIANGIKG